jgi:hypothetical protein
LIYCSTAQALWPNVNKVKTITLVAYNRLRYLARTLESLRQNTLDDYTLFIGVEPEDEDVADYCKRIDWIPTRVTVNRERYGVAWNPFHTINRAIEAGSSFNIAIEDDLFLAPDALQLANWYQRYANQHLCLCFCNYSSVTHWPDIVFRAKTFVPLGYCFSRDAWMTYFEPNWMSDKRGWDFSVQALINERPSCHLLVPGLARATHIGREEGSHCTVQYHDRVFKDMPISREKQQNFRIDMNHGGVLYDAPEPVS